MDGAEGRMREDEDNQDNEEALERESEPVPGTKYAVITEDFGQKGHIRKGYFTRKCDVESTASTRQKRGIGLGFFTVQTLLFTHVLRNPQVS